MREIKFRGISKEKGIFVYGCYIKASNEKEEIHAILEIGKSIDFITEVIKESVWQFTGLKDKNGIDIYEGDIVDYGNGRNREVEFIEGCFCICRITAMPCLMTHFKIIGNIHENPELLK